MGDIRISTALHASADLAQEVTGLVQQLSTTAAPLTVDALAELIASDSATLLIASSDTCVVGMLTLITYRIPTGIRARIEDVVVNESARGKGVAFELTRAAVDLARNVGARTVDLTSRPSRESANRLYQRAGFSPRDSLTYRRTLDGYASPMQTGQAISY
ncbi:GNAT family N-acetyltransferase [Nocardia sp. NBC_01499]|uniref:GNAT family N-acetyltransferase n=1 Tax=Nocardia sp. NBC_01499 TaxID=2903597 RepID=UPI003869DBAA